MEGDEGGKEGKKRKMEGNEGGNARRFLIQCKKRKMEEVPVADEQGLANRCWNKFNKELVFAIYTPFYVCFASGLLDSKTFVHCLAQDVYFCKAFTMAYERAEEYVDGDENKIAIRKLRKSVEDEYKARDVHLRELKLELPKESPPNNSIRKYTDFLLATASGKVGEKSHGQIATPFEKTKVAAYILAAIAPWKRFIVFIRNEIKAALDPDYSSHNYWNWNAIFFSQVFEASALPDEAMLDKLSVSLTDKDVEVIENLYHRAMKFTVDLLSGQPISQKIIVPLSRVDDLAKHRLTIFCGFEWTCTSEDIFSVLAEIAFVGISKSKTQLAQMSADELRSTWVGLSDQYREEYEQCIESIMRSKTAEFNYEVLCDALEQFSDFKKRANSRVVQSGVLKHLNFEDIKWAGQHFNLQDGCKQFFQKIVQTENLKTDVHVLSYCLCGDLIRSAFLSGDLNVVNVHSNELAYEESISTGEIVRKVESPREILKAFNNILKGLSNDSNHLTVYIGGLVGDLLGLLNADIGIVIGSNSSLWELGNQFGISFVPLFSGVVKKQKEPIEGSFSTWKRPSGILYTVSSWLEIQAFILGP